MTQRPTDRSKRRLLALTGYGLAAVAGAAVLAGCGKKEKKAKGAGAVEGQKFTMK